MDGPKHYAAAEKLLDLAETYRRDGAYATAALVAAEAQAYATLALAAATALGGAPAPLTAGGSYAKARQGIDYAARVTKGAALLDEKMPGWERRIDPSELDVSVSNTCVLGWVYGGYATGVAALDVGIVECIEHGFALGVEERTALRKAMGLSEFGDCDLQPAEIYAPLTQAWRDAINARMAAQA